MTAALRLAAVLLLATSPAVAAETGGCGRFPWPVEADMALLAKADNLKSGATIDASAPLAVRLGLGDQAQAGFEIPPERAPSPQAPAGSLRFEARAGTYQITLTDGAWTDLVQDGRAMKPTGFGGVVDCDGARKTLRYELSAGPATLQISNSHTRAIGVAITPYPGR